MWLRSNASNRTQFPVSDRTNDTLVPVPSQHHDIEQISIPAGVFVGDSSGDADPREGETPQHAVELGGFRIDATTVTNAGFARLVAEIE